METCKTCKYWLRELPNEFSNNRFNECICPHLHYEYEYCNAEVMNNEVVIENDEGAQMRTGPEFGCIHHTAA